MVQSSRGIAQTPRNLEADNFSEDNSLVIYNGPSSLQSKMNVITEPKYLSKSNESNEVATKGTKDTSEQLQILRFPESLFSFTQATAKGNGEPEKYLSGWPLLTSSEIQLQKCNKCSREFCSAINLRRHIRGHRRPFNKESAKNRENLCAYWDKLSWDKAKEIVSIKDVTVKDLSGSSVIRELKSLIRIMRLSALPDVYLKAGIILLDVVDARHSSSPISSEELFRALDDASERTFMFAGTAQSVEKFIFDVDARTISLEMKNIVAMTSFMVELKLVEAWLADKAAEALRCQKLLLEEEEAALRRQSEALERKRLKKLRQKEERPKGLFKAEATAGKELFLTHQLDSTLVKVTQNGFHTHEATTDNSSILLKNDNYKDLEPVASNNGNKICPEKIKPGDQNLSATVSQKVYIDEDRDQEHKAQPCSCRENVIMIGSLILPLGNGNDQCSEKKCNHDWFYLAEDFLAQRWKGAMEAQHVKLVLSPEAENLPKDD